MDCDMMRSGYKERVQKEMVSSAKIVVSGTAEKPYYEIEYRDLKDGKTHVGYGSYDLGFVFGFLKECFEIVRIAEKLVDAKAQKQVRKLRDLANYCQSQNVDYYTAPALSEAADTIEVLSAKLAAANMERSVAHYGGEWIPISEYSRDKYDWVLIKYFDGEEECVPQVAELRSDGKWHVSTDFDGDFTIPSRFDVRYFFDMQQFDNNEP